MTGYVRTFTCLDCGADTTRMRNWGQPLVCVDCGIARAVVAAHAMVARTGPAWEAHQRNPGGRPIKVPPPTE